MATSPTPMLNAQQMSAQQNQDPRMQQYRAMMAQRGNQLGMGPAGPAPTPNAAMMGTAAAPRIGSGQMGGMTGVPGAGMPMQGMTRPAPPWAQQTAPPGAMNQGAAAGQPIAPQAGPAAQANQVQSRLNQQQPIGQPQLAGQGMAQGGTPMTQMFGAQPSWMGAMRQDPRLAGMGPMGNAPGTAGRPMPPWATGQQGGGFGQQGVMNRMGGGGFQRPQWQNPQQQATPTQGQQQQPLGPRNQQNPAMQQDRRRQMGF